MAQLSEQQLLVPLALPEAAAYPAQMKSDFWVATDSQFYIAGWNTNLFKKGEEPKNFEDLANAKWKNSLMGEPRDFQLLIGFAKRRYNSVIRQSICSSGSLRTKCNFIPDIRS